MNEVAQDSRGNWLLVELNEMGQNRYWSDEIGGGVVVWDTTLVSAEMLMLAYQNEMALMKAPRPDKDGWSKVGLGTPLQAVLETKREGERGTNRCWCRILAIGDLPEWIEMVGGRTTVTHSTFLPPTHWRWPLESPNAST